MGEFLSTPTESNPMTLLPSPRRFLRFSLKAVLLLVLIIAISLGWAMHKVREQGIAIREMSEAGARFAVEYAHRRVVDDPGAV